MKIGVYSDAHICRSSSILTGKSPHSIYSKRHYYLLNSFKWMYKLFKDNKVDLVINCGDLTNTDILSAEDNTLLSAVLSHRVCPEIHILGNHEVSDTNNMFNSLNMLKGYDDIELITDFRVIKDIVTDLDLILVPYTNDEESIRDSQNYIVGSINKSLVFSHMNYINDDLVRFNGFLSSNALDRDVILSNKYILKIFNGHLHNPIDTGNYYQVGSLIGSSFSDSYCYSKPRVLIYDTSTDEVKSFVNPESVLFYKIRANSIIELEKKLKDISSNKLCLQVTTTYRDVICEYLMNNKEKLGIEEYRVRSENVETSSISKINKEDKFYEKLADSSISSKDYCYKLLSDFTKISEDCPYSYDIMNSFLKCYIEGNDNDKNKQQ